MGDGYLQSCLCIQMESKVERKRLEMIQKKSQKGGSGRAAESREGFSSTTGNLAKNNGKWSCCRGYAVQCAAYGGTAQAASSHALHHSCLWSSSHRRRPLQYPVSLQLTVHLSYGCRETRHPSLFIPRDTYITMLHILRSHGDGDLHGRMAPLHPSFK